MGRDIKLATERIAGYRAFANKLWNAARFALMNLEDFDPAGIRPREPRSSRWPTAGSWSAWRDRRATSTRRLAEYKFNEAASALYAFTWHSSATGTSS